MYPVTPASNSTLCVIGRSLAFNLQPKPSPPLNVIVGSSKKSNPASSILISSTFPTKDKFALAPDPSVELVVDTIETSGGFITSYPLPLSRTSIFSIFP